MNTSYRLVWSCARAAWVAVAEITRSNGRAGALVVCLLGGTTAWAACQDLASGGNGVVFASAGSSCDAVRAAYSGSNTAYAAGPGTVLTFTAPSVTISGGNASYSLAVGGANIGGIGAVPGSTVITNGNLSVINNGTGSSRALYVYGGTSAGGTGNLLSVAGNLIVGRGGASGAAIENVGGDIQVNGTTTATTTGADAFRNGGTGTFRGAASFTATGAGRGLFVSGGALDFRNTLGITTASGHGIAISAGDIAVSGNMNIGTAGASAYGISQSGGSVNATGTTRIETAGADAYGISATGSGATFVTPSLDSVIATQGSGAHGLFANAAGSVVALGTTAGASTGPTIVLGSGSVSTQGDDAEALYVLSSASNVTLRATQSGGSIATAGINADGVVAYGNGSAATGVSVVAEQTGGRIETTGGASILGNGSSGLVAQLDGAGTASATQAQGAVINTTGTAGHGMLVSTGLLSGSGTFSISQGGSIVTSGTGAAGAIVTVRSGDVTASQTGTGTITTGGASAHGLSATTLAGAVSVDQRGSIRTDGNGSHGISVSATTDASVRSEGTVLAQGNAIVIASSGTARVDVVGASLTSVAGDGIDASGAAQGVSITNSGSITATSAGGLVIRGSAAADQIFSSAGTLSGDTDLGTGHDRFSATGGTLAGAVRMGDGDDTITLSGTVNLIPVTQLDGGTGSDTLTLDGVSLRGFTAASNDAGGNVLTGNNTNLTGWEIIELLNGSTLKLSGNLFVAAAPGLLRIGPGATLDLRGNSPGVFTLHGNVNNAGVLAMDDGAPDDVTTITGNYQGQPGAQLRTDTTWLQPNTLLTDRLVIQGTAGGTTTVTVAGGILGDVTRADQLKVSSVPVVQVAQAHAGNAFVGTAATPNAGQAQLMKIGNDYFWTLEADKTPIIAPPVPGYVLGQVASLEMGFSQIGKLHERVSEQLRGAHPAPVWGRIGASQLDLQGRDRYGIDGASGFLQFGTDLHVATDEQGQRHSRGLTATWGWGNFDLRDASRAQNGAIVGDKRTGTARADTLALGGYSTWYTAEGGYLDLVGQLAWLRNTYRSRDGDSAQTHGGAIALSAEVGHPIAIGDAGWSIEPQAQMIYQRVALRDFSDGVREVRPESLDGLRGRLGARLAWNERAPRAPGTNQARTLYLTANVLHDFTSSTPQIAVGRDIVNERMGRTWAELGAGVQWALAKGGHFYTDLRVQRSFDRSGMGEPTRRSLALNVGIKTHW